jgi:hypothetical protein
MLLAAAAVALVSPSSVACCGSIRGASRTPASYSNTLSHIFSRDFLSEHNVAMMLAMLAAAGIETSTDQLDNLVCCMAHVAPYTSHLTPHTSHLTPHTSHLTPHTSQVLPLWMVVVAAAAYD